MSSSKYRNFDVDTDSAGGETSAGVSNHDTSVSFRAGTHFWNSRSLLEKCLLIILLVFVGLVIILAALVGTKHVQVQQLKTEKESLCMTKECVTLASNVLNYMDPSVDPCTDFYSYACGGWQKNHPIPSGHPRWSTFDELQQKNLLVLKNALENLSGNETSEAEHKAQVYFQACMDVNDTIQTLGAKPMHELMKRFGGWSVSEEGPSPWSASDWIFQSTLTDMHKMGLSVFFSMYVTEDEKDVNRNVIQVDQAGLGLARDQYLTNKTIDDDKVLKAYLTYLTTLGVLMGGEKNDTERQMREVIEWERDLANITAPSEERRDEEKLYHNMTVAELQKLTESVNWLDYLNTLFNETGLKLQQTEPVVVYAPDFLQSLDKLIKEKLQTDRGKRLLNNYMKSHFITAFSNYLSEPFVEAARAFSKALSGTEGNIEKWRYCLQDTGQTLGFALGTMFVRSAFEGTSRDQAENMVTSIKTAFKKNLPNLDWLDTDTKALAIEKVEAVVNKIGYPDYILNTTALNEKYHGLEVRDNEYFQNNLRDINFSMHKSLAKLRKKPDKTLWEMTPQTVNAYYSPTKNEIVFPAGILQAPFFDEEYPTYVNYGGMGVVMGHELTHGFDDQGREYDKTGLLKPWWKNATISKFSEQAKCFVDEYSAFVENNEHIHGKTTVGENIADNGGLTAAYHAYEKWIADNGEEKKLPGVDLTGRQLFFMAFAQVWCSNTKPEDEHLLIISDPHSPGKFRVLGTLQNSVEFSKQYNCPIKSPMNPAKKCVIW